MSIPEGATHEMSGSFYIKKEPDFYDIQAGRIPVLVWDYAKWHEVFLNDDAPLVEIGVEPYQPEVGEWCEYVDRDIHSKNGPVFFIGINQDGEAVYSDAYNHLFRVSKEVEFQPIKTERDILIDIILGVDGMSEGVLADAILDAGFKGPGDE